LTFCCPAARRCSSREAAAKVACAITSGAVCATGANPPSCRDELSTNCLAASLQDCQTKVAITPMQNATRKRGMARASRMPGRASSPATGPIFSSSREGMVASTEGSAGNQTTEYSDCVRFSTEPIAHPPSQPTPLLCESCERSKGEEQLCPISTGTPAMRALSTTQVECGYIESRPPAGTGSSTRKRALLSVGKFTSTGRREISREAATDHDVLRYFILASAAWCDRGAVAGCRCQESPGLSHRRTARAAYCWPWACGRRPSGAATEKRRHTRWRKRPLPRIRR